MHARVAVYEIPGHRMGDAVAAFGNAIDQIRELSPLEVYVLVSRDDDRALTMSVLGHTPRHGGKSGQSQRASKRCGQYGRWQRPERR